MFQKTEKGSFKPLINTRYPAPGTRQPDCGFTLLEIMIAIFIFSIVVTIIFGSYNYLFSGNETLDQGVASYEMAETCLNRMVVDLESIHVTLPPEYTPPAFDDSHDLYRISGDTVDVQGAEFPILRFTSRSHLPFGGKTQSGIAEIVYYVQAENNGHYLLKRADNLYPYPSFEEKTGDPVLCKDIKSLAFKYYDREGTEYDLWNSESDNFGYSTPRAVGIKLELAVGSDSRWFETMITLPVFRGKKSKR